MKIIFNKLVLFLSLALFLPLLTIQNGMATSCGQPGGECGGTPFKDCCDKAKYECRSIYTDEKIADDSDEFGECKEKSKEVEAK